MRSAWHRDRTGFTTHNESVTQPSSSIGRPRTPAPGAAAPELRIARLRSHARRLSLSALVLIGVAGASVEPEIRGDSAGDPDADRRLLNSSAIRQELGWEPRYRDFEEGLARTVEWYRDHEEWWRPHKEATEQGYAAKGQ